MKNKTLITLLALFAAAISLYAAEPVSAKSSAEARKPVLKIGVVTPLTGDNAHVGEETRRGIDWAVQEQKTKAPFDIKLIYEDSRLENRQNNLSALKLIQLNRVDAIISIWTDAAYILAPLADRYKVPHFNTGWDHDPSNKHWTLVHGGDFYEYARQSVEIMKLHHTKRLGITAMTEKGVIDVIDAAKSYLKAAGIEIVFNELYPPGTRDFRTYVLKLRESKPDFIWNLNRAPEDEMIFRAMAQTGIKAPSSGFYFYTDPSLYRYLEGAMFPQTQTSADFDKRFASHYGRAPKLLEAAYCYDITNIIIEAAKDQYSKLRRMPTHEELLAEMKRPQSLPYSAFKGAEMVPNGWVKIPYILRQIKDGKKVDFSQSK